MKIVAQLVFLSDCYQSHYRRGGLHVYVGNVLYIKTRGTSRFRIEMYKSERVSLSDKDEAPCLFPC